MGTVQLECISFHTDLHLNVSSKKAIVSTTDFNFLYESEKHRNTLDWSIRDSQLGLRILELDASMIDITN